LVTRHQPPAKKAGFDRLALVAFMITGYGNTLSALIGGLGGPGRFLRPDPLDRPGLAENLFTRIEAARFIKSGAGRKACPAFGNR
jgi:hypothetical protein